MTIEALQKEMLKQPQAEIETIHAFMNGIYARQIIIPAGVVIVGAKHKTEHPHLISKGKCYIVNNDKQEYFEAPYSGITKPGAKRAIYAIEETVFTTFHPTEETDIKKIEAEIIEPEGLRIANNPESDHDKFKIEYGITDELESAVMSITEDLDESLIDGIMVKGSNIHGLGCFTDRIFDRLSVIGDCRTAGGERTILGRYTNHAKTPNCIPIRDGNKITLVAIKRIESGSEITIDYRDSIKANTELKEVLSCPG